MQTHPPLTLLLDKITKVYAGVVAVQDVSLQIRAGEVVGLIGENGAGKSTMMKVLGGAIRPDSGAIIIDGARLTHLTPTSATQHGIAFVHQELNAFTNLDVAGNILLGREIATGPFRRLNRSAMAQAVQPVLTLIGARFGPHDRVADLSLAELQLLEIARALSMNARLIILDEPTSSLTLTESQTLLRIIAGLKAQGVAVLFISHRLDEVAACADRVVVLRDGRNAGELAQGQMTRDAMIRLMIGRDLTHFREKSRHVPGAVLLDLTDVATVAFPHARACLTVHGGEIVGLAGLVGAGRTELARAVFGIDPVVHGTVTLEGAVLPPLSVAHAIARGLCLVPEDRKEQGLILDFAIAPNIALPSLSSLSRNGRVDLAAEQAMARQGQDALAIKAPSLDTAAAELSGGNQQKVVLAKWLAMEPRVMIFDEPTRGIDVGAKAEIYRLMQALAARGVAILMISSDMEEVIGVSDRVAVMRRGEIAGILAMDEVSEHRILNLAVG